MTNHHEFRPERLLCVVAHPDDVEVCIGATVAKWAAQGTETCILICTNGANGTSDLEQSGDMIAKIRVHEQMAAASILGVTCWHQLEYDDGHVELSDHLRHDIVKHIRCHKPDVVFTMDPSFMYSTHWNYPNHRDHRVIGAATFDAVYPMARDVSSCRDLLAEDLTPHAVQHLLMTNFDKQNHYVDVTGYFEQKAQALRAHPSQFGDAAGVIDWQRRMCTENGNQCGAELAEAFVRLTIF